MVEFRKDPRGEYFFAHKGNTLAIVHTSIDNAFMWILHREVCMPESWVKYYTYFEKCEKTTVKEYKKAKKLYVDLVDYDILK